jgi:hypothetical protein
MSNSMMELVWGMVYLVTVRAKILIMGSFKEVTNKGRFNAHPIMLANGLK